MILRSKDQYTILKIIKLVFCCSKLYTSLIIIYSLVSILIPSLKMLSTSSFIDTTLSKATGFLNS